uniref:cytochrome c oxidase subunit 2 n=1 Tax=Euplotes vannus TaxID=5939 RepID=UPI002E7952FA|nr:cytochrome c oxidase subunit 2 [Euplotes vannus]UPM52092.1 cytochrome c oxidase subunit 2 [Euplotes vannus]
MFSFDASNVLVPSTYDFSFYPQLVDALFTSGVSIKASILDYADLFPEKEFSILHTSTPNIKMYYPEPFIASPTFINDDIWFLHITIYQYWLWFIFISLIVFFFLGFLITLRWCNIRHRPARETRGVSRSKCGDLITATVPVSWAASIIIHESTDAIEFADGFGSTDVAIGIRAYQWGWEYYYPKGLNLTNQLNDTNFLGNSLSSTSALVDDSLSTFKAASINSDYAMFTLSAHTAGLLSLTSSKNTTTLADYNFGGNKLIARYATNLIDTNICADADQVFTSAADANLDLETFYTNFINYSAVEIFTEKPNYVNHQFNFFSTKASFLNALNFLNWHDWCSVVRQLVVTPGTTSVTQALRLPIKESLGLALIAHTDVTASTKQFLGASASWLLTNTLSWNSALIADQDFKRWSAFDLLEDLHWTPTDWLDDTTPQLQNSYVDLYSQPYRKNSLISDLTLTECLYPITTYQPQPLLVFAQLTPSDNHLSNLVNSLVMALKSRTFYSWKQHQLHWSSVDFSLNFGLDTHNLVLSAKDLLFNFSAESLPSTFLTSRKTVVMDSFDWLLLWRNLNTYHGAFWKVFKPLLDEQRGTFNSINFSNTAIKLPVIGYPAPGFLGQAQKSNFNGFAVLLPLRTELHFKKFSNYCTFGEQRASFFPFPFNLSFESDSIRYSWFDWYAVRNSVIAKALDTSVFNLHASRDYSYTFNSTTSALKLVNQYENYFFKYSHARKFYLPSYLYTPFFHRLKQNSAIAGNLLANQSLNSYLSLINALVALNNKITSTDFSFNWAGALTQTRPYLETYDLTTNQVSPLTSLTDIESRKNYLVNIIKGAGERNTNPNISLKYLLQDWVHGKQLNCRKLNFHKPIDYVSTAPVPLVSQYQPLRKGIVNMIRIQADKAIAMPTDTRLQILAVSKDIIHSWAIPAAGIKIDCIPGYSSHRVAIFTLSGIYWGQCMEICGRFHHWMPIVVYFLRRDLFCLWCIHFIFKNNQTNSTLQSLTHQTTDSTIAVTVPNAANVWAYVK